MYIPVYDKTRLCGGFIIFGQVIPIPDKNLPNTCEDFVARQGGTADAGQEGPLESADAGLWQKTARIW